MSVLLFNDGPDCILHVCKLGSWQCGVVVVVRCWAYNLHLLIKRLLCRITIVYTLHFFYVHVIIPELNGVTTGARLKKSPPTPTPIVPAPSESPPSLDLNIFPSAAAL